MNNLDVKIKKIVIYTDWLETYLAKEHYMFVKNLEQYGWEIIKLSKLNIKNIKKNSSIILCVTYDDFDISQLKCNNIKLIYRLDDIYPYKKIRNKCINNADLIISPYQYLFKKVNNIYKNIDIINSVWIPYSAVNYFYKDINFNYNPIKKIFISGAICKSIYPLRYYISNDNKFNNYIEKLEHPSYNNYKHNVINENYYKKLNNYLCCFVDSSIYNYILLKVFEICSVGSLLLVTETIEDKLNELGFYNNINCIFCNKDNLLNKIKWILNDDNKNDINEIRKKGMDLVRQNHTTLHRSEKFNNIINNFNFIKTNKEVSKDIYSKELWNNSNKNIPLPGPSSSLKNKKLYSDILNKLKNKKLKK